VAVIITIAVLIGSWLAYHSSLHCAGSAGLFPLIYSYSKTRLSLIFPEISSNIKFPDTDAHLYI